MHPDSIPSRPDRRSVLRTFGALGGAAFLPRFQKTPDEGRCLVLVQLSGGNDGLSTLVPYADDAYHRARRSTRLQAGDVLAIDEELGLHPELRNLHHRFQEGEVAFVEGVGYDHPVRSHFKSMDVWHAASERGRGLAEGWIGRAARSAWGEEVRTGRIVHIGTKAPYALHSTLHAPLVFPSASSLRFVTGEAELVRIAQRPLAELETAPPRSRRRELLRRSILDAHRASHAVRSAVERYRPAAAYPQEPFAQDLRTAAALLHSEVAPRVVSVELTGFDTHAGQRSRHDRQMRLLDDGLGAFLEDLSQSSVGSRTVVLAFSEFGRRVAENASRGTDHGTAGPLLLAGAPVRGGLFGRRPSLTDLDGEGDLVFTTDFRRAYASVLRWVFGLQPRVVLGGDWQPLGCLG